MSGALDGKAVVVTGAGRGIGAAVATLAAAEGAAVVVNDVDGTAADAVAAGVRAAGGTAVADHSDVSSWDEARELVDHCVAEWGAIDGLVNNAALFAFGTPAEMTELDWRSLVESNVYGTAFCGTHALEAMARRGRGAIVNVTSGSHLGARSQSVYSATKGAVASLTYSWALDVAGTGIRVNALSPMAATRMNTAIGDYFAARGKPNPMVVTVTPEHNAPVVVFLLSDEAAGVHGQVVRIDGPRLALMAHPAVLHPPLVRDTWTLDDVREAFATTLSGRQQPLGVVATTAETVPYWPEEPPGG